MRTSWAVVALGIGLLGAGVPARGQSIVGDYLPVVRVSHNSPAAGPVTNAAVAPAAPAAPAAAAPPVLATPAPANSAPIYTNPAPYGHRIRHCFLLLESGSWPRLKCNAHPH